MTTDNTKPLIAYLRLLVGLEPGGSFIEIRYRQGAAMRQQFIPTTQVRAAANTIEKLGRRTDVYVGCAPRQLRAGGRDAIAHAWVVWVDCDTEAAARALDRFEPPPTLVVASGSPHGRHGYWGLSAPADAPTLERANHRLAQSLSGDPQCTDAARILRPPGTRNFKHTPPGSVHIVSLSGAIYATASDVVDRLPDPPRATSIHSHGRGRDCSSDPLLAIPPARYVAALTGQEPNRGSKIACPFHRDDTPSLHVYATPERGWYCYGCGRGGSIFDLAGELWEVERRARDFIRLRRELIALFPAEPARARATP